MIRYYINFTNFTSGSYLGRDDGYPFTDKIIYDDVQKFITGLSTINRIVDYGAERVTALSKSELDKIIKDAEHIKAMKEGYQRRKDKEERLAQIKKEAEMLEKELGRG